MTESHTLPPNVHPTVALLPWYVNGTLSAADRATVSAHLQECLSCRTELDELVRLSNQIKQAVSAGPMPSAGLAQTVLSRVREEAQRGQDQVHHVSPVMTEPSTLMANIDRWLRKLFVPQWVPTFVATLLVVQLGVLLWTVSQPSRTIDVGGSITSRGLGSPTARLRVEFQPTASAQQIQTLLQDIRGRVVDGPNTEGVYIMEIPASDPATVVQQLQALQSRQEVIRHVEGLGP
jgi:predicted anti-sigma-YlaC factor YlaD